MKAAGVVLVCLCLIAGAAFGIHKMIRSKAVGWQGEGLHRYFVSPATGTRVQGLYEINHSLYYFGSNHFLKIGWIKDDGYTGYADQDGKITQGEAKVDGKYYYFQPETGQLYTGWLALDGVEYCYDETGHPRTGTYQENGKTWELDSDGRVKGRLNGWKKVEGILKYYDETGAPAQGWIQIEGKDYFFVDGISQAGTFQEGTLSSNLNGSGSVQPGGDATPEEDLAEDAEGEPPEEILEEQPTQTEAGQTSSAEEQLVQSEEVPAPEPETTLESPTELETSAIEQQEEGTENT